MMMTFSVCFGCSKSKTETEVKTTSSIEETAESSTEEVSESESTTANELTTVKETSSEEQSTTVEITTIAKPTTIPKETTTKKKTTTTKPTTTKKQEVTTKVQETTTKKQEITTVKPQPTTTSKNEVTTKSQTTTAKVTTIVNQTTTEEEITTEEETTTSNIIKFDTSNIKIEFNDVPTTTYEDSYPCCNYKITDYRCSADKSTVNIDTNFTTPEEKWVYFTLTVKVKCASAGRYFQVNYVITDSAGNVIEDSFIQAKSGDTTSYNVGSYYKLEDSFHLPAVADTYTITFD